MQAFLSPPIPAPLLRIFFRLRLGGGKKTPYHCTRCTQILNGFAHIIEIVADKVMQIKTILKKVNIIS